MVKHKHFSIKKLIVIATFSLFAIGGAVFTYMQLSGKKVAEGTDTVSSVNYGPPTEDERLAGDKIKEVISQDEDERNRTDKVSKTQKKKADVLITSAGQYDDDIEIRAFISNHFEDGTCTMWISREDEVFKRDAPAYTDYKVTSCTVPGIRRSELGESGTWKVWVVFTSPGAEGKSEVQEIKVK